MDEKDIEQFKNLLLAMQINLQQQQNSTKQSTEVVQLDQSSVGRLSRMDAMQSQAMALESKRRVEQQLQRIEAALERIEEGEFGYCAMCEEEIARKRLEVDPANPFCVTCASNLS